MYITYSQSPKITNSRQLAVTYVIRLPAFQTLHFPQKVRFAQGIRARCRVSLWQSIFQNTNSSGNPRRSSPRFFQQFARLFQERAGSGFVPRSREEGEFAVEEATKEERAGREGGSCNSKLFQWNGIVNRWICWSPELASSSSVPRKREAELRKATLL